MLILCRIYDGIYLYNRLTLGNSGEYREFDALPRSIPLAGAGPNVPDSLLPEILDKVLKDALRLSPIRIGKHRHKFAGVTAGRKAPDGAEVFIDKQSHAPDGLLRRIMA